MRFYKPQITKDELSFLATVQDGIWILKPVHTKRAPLIFTNVMDVKEHIKAKKPAQRLPWPKKHTFFLERYLENIHTYGDRKYSLRTYMIIPWNHPRIVFYREGYVVINPNKYDMENLDLKNRTGKWSHLVKIEYYKNANATAHVAEKFLLIDEYKQVLKSEGKSQK